MNLFNNMLKKIIKHKYKWIIDRKIKQPIKKILFKIKKSNKNFYKIFNYPYTKFILECKKKSPYMGVMRENFNIIDIVNKYKKYASIISIVTDKKYFDGSFENMLLASKNTNLPILCKDFIIDIYQVYLARLYGADSITLMLSVLKNHQYIILSNLSHSLNMGVITEISNESELNRAIFLNSKVISINNLNLKDMSININKTKILSIKIPRYINIISESGIKCYSQIRSLSCFVNGFLIGSSLMKEKNLEKAICRITLGENKICGLKRMIDADIAYKSGAIYGGLIFNNYSSRIVNIKQAKKISNNIPLDYVGVFKNQSISYILHVLNNVNLKIIQLNGEENQKYINILKKYLSNNIKIWKLISIKNFLSKKKKIININRYILDNKIDNKKKNDFNLLKKYNFNKVILSGGINLKNCMSATKIGFVGLNLNSGIETKPGIKNIKKIINLFHKIRIY
ncbi:Tryptophan biosynthesis protein TrpCF [Candidatus Annandia adelgestsuga]|uniref:N-(5'-phosphoribosyl)anthranilate isomerase n=1 Tax=Candidatus Annandia adelgestsuga TaxID=1302411 RepID=A0A3Q9CLN7_9ENTR|nr:bifunctional indole-3-glycerol-phosphate synthase TrpC/phosphoribosylanthranilate isomerase TrpF [Candidatus Annandia adelgestsuga]AZP36413.1 Tryptophan biosynthesis protein TrpCF [Candidatus Annandia adelgestsuga]